MKNENELLNFKDLTNYLLHMPLLNKIIISVCLGVVLTPLCFKLHYVFYGVSLLLILCGWIFNSQNQARIFCKVVIGLLIICGMYFILVNTFFGQNFDDYETVMTWTGVNKVMFFERLDGRFHPTGLLEYGLLSKLPYGYTSVAHIFLNAIMFALFIFLIAGLLDFRSKQKTSHLYIKLFLLISLIFTANAIFSLFYSYARFHRAAIFFTALFLFSYKRMCGVRLESKQGNSASLYFNRGGSGEWITPRGKKNFWIIIALVSVLWVTYLKEIAFGVFVVLAMTNFLFNVKTMKIEDKVFNFLLLVNAPIYLMFYYFFAFRNAQGFYGVQTSTFMDRLWPFVDNPLLILIVVFTIIRLYFLLLKKDRNHIFYDGLLFMAFGYFFAHELLGLIGENEYFAPSIIIFMPVLCHWLTIFYDRKNYMKFVLICLFIFSITIPAKKLIVNNFLLDYTSSKTGIYNLIKLDRFSKVGIPLYIYHRSRDYSVLWTAHIGAPYGLNYINSEFFEPKALDDTEIKFSTSIGYKSEIIDPGAHGYKDVIEEGDGHQININGIYVSNISNLPEIDDRFSDFIAIGHWLTDAFSTEALYSYAHKDIL